MKNTFTTIAFTLLISSVIPAAAFVTPRSSSSNALTKTKNPRTPFGLVSRSGQESSSESILVRGGASREKYGHLAPRQGTELSVNKSGQSSSAEVEPNLLPSIFFLLSAASLGKLAVDIYSSSLPTTIGIWSLFFTTIAVGWDNFIIGLGKPFFSDAETNEEQYNILKTLSFPRFTAHAVLVPFLYTTGAEIGKAAGVEWLQGDFLQTALIVAAAAVGIISRVRFVQSSGIEIADTSDSPPEALENQLLWFTYKEPEFLYIVPSIILSIFNLAIGVAAFGGEFNAAAIWMVVSGVSVLYGNAKPSYVTRFTGNLAEVVMLWAIYAAASASLIV